jgi:hypothetical protein
MTSSLVVSSLTLIRLVNQWDSSEVMFSLTFCLDCERKLLILTWNARLRSRTSDYVCMSRQVRDKFDQRKEHHEKGVNGISQWISLEIKCWFKCLASCPSCLSPHFRLFWLPRLWRFPVCGCHVRLCFVHSFIYLLREQLLWFWSCFAYAFILWEETKSDFSASRDWCKDLHDAKSLAVPSFIRFSSLSFSSTSYPCAIQVILCVH